MCSKHDLMMHGCGMAAAAHQRSCHAGEGAGCQPRRDAEVALPVSQAPLRGFVCAQLNCAVWHHLQYLRSTCSTFSGGAWQLFGVAAAFASTCACNKRASPGWIACSGSLPIFHRRHTLLAFRQPFMSCHVQPALCADTHLRHIPLPVAHEALLLAYGDQSAYNASPTCGLL